MLHWDRSPVAEAWRQIAQGRTLGVYFSYRSSSGRMITLIVDDYFVDDGDPPLVSPGMTLLRLDPQGRLRYLRVVPKEGDEGHGQTFPFEWSRLFKGAGLDAASFTAVPPAMTPKQAFDTQGAWIEKDSTIPLRVEAAAWRGRPVWFTVTPGATIAGSSPSQAQRGVAAQVLLWFFLLSTTSILAYRNSKLGRIDWQGMIRVAVACTVLGVVSAFLAQRLSLDVLAYVQITRALRSGLFVALEAGVGYVALEPLIRRRWPALLISWTRAWRGGLRGPLVGRDLLLGLLSGVWLVSIAIHPRIIKGT